MDAETSSTTNHLPGFLHRSLPAVVPTLLVSIGYVDPGKWAATIEGGARFGSDLMAFMLIFNFAAIFCQYMSAKIGIITGRDLAQICSDEYDTWTCMLLGIQAEVSVIMLDLNMILGMAQGLNLVFGWDLFTCVFLTATGAVFHLLLALLLDIEKAKILGLYVTGFVLLSFVLGVLINQPGIPLFMNGVLTKLSGESAFVLMSLLGATLMPHNLYLHSFIVQWHQRPIDISQEALCHKHFLAIFCVFNGLYLVNNVVMNASANEFYGTGLVLLTFQDALASTEQVLHSPIALLAFLLILFLANQATALTWSLGGEVVVNGFLKLDIPSWLHYATIRMIAVLPALYCAWSSGAEGMYRLLIFTQVLVALQLPSSVIPLFRVATSSSIMGVHKVSQFVELLALVIVIGMLGLNIVFVVEMLFGSSDWVCDLRWNVGNGVSISYLVLLIVVFASICFMLWLATTPLRSASIHLEAQVLKRDMPETVSNLPIDGEESYLTEERYHGDTSVQVKEPTPTLVARTLNYSDVTVQSFHPDLPETKTEPGLHVTAVKESHSLTSFPSSPKSLAKESESEAVSTVVSEISDSRVAGTKTVKVETSAPVGKKVEVEGDSIVERDDDVDSWETEKSSKVVSTCALSSTSDGPASFRSLNGKSDEGENSIGSLSRLGGLGRAGRRQLAAVLDEFWGQLYDFHGQATREAKAKKLDVLLGGGIDSRSADSLQKVVACGKEYSEDLASVGGRASNTLMNSNLYDSSKQPRIQSSLESSHGLQRSSSSIQANPIQLLDAYVHSQNSSCNLLDSGERRYSSVRNLPSSEDWDYQPATIHGYQPASYLNRDGNGRNFDYLNGPMQPSSLKFPSMGNTNYRDSIAFALGGKLHNRVGLGQPPGFQHVSVSRNSQLQSERPYYDLVSSGLADNAVSSVNNKKYHSLPDISGYAIPHRTGYVSDKNAPWDGSVGYRPSASKTYYEQSSYSNSGSRTRPHLAFDELSPSKVYREALSSQLNSGFDTGSLWSRQPFEQFGVAEKSNNVAMEGVGIRPNTAVEETTSFVDIEAKLLQSFRLCIVKLLKLEGSDWLFRQNDGIDEDLIDRVAAREKFVYEVESREMDQVAHKGEAQYFSSDRKPGSSIKNNDAYSSSFSVSSVPNCGEGCIWRSDLIISFGVWCIHRILDLSLMESRPELWGKYTYVLNRLQGIVDPAFSKPRSPMVPCFCLQVLVSHQQKSSPPLSNGMLPPTSKPGRGKYTTASTLLELIKDVEIAISSRKGRSGTAAGDVAFPKGKENLASVLKRYKRKLSSKPANTH
ncbi:hypothetical protein TanjilG_09955 [Lupinus angustifolius]|uniref:Ethylene-insensitive protein 2 n=1 Tax=Lupinus angustifolius TaxID=3871 RepID=A0A1J7FW89_LUPAN|nr:PREDICTED: ethylene-insensitive protein 2-like [Lupinus angustifolius]OIV92357.1 hypothetical protein TanjilG_09955 [Lupinus angustifolius]